MKSSVSIRRATGEDAEGICAIWRAIVAERDYSAVDRAFTTEEEKSYIESLSEREAVFVALESGQVIAFQTLDLWLDFLSSMNHVGQVGTFVRRDFRGIGIGKSLADQTMTFARDHGYEKLIIFVRAKNMSAQGFYKKLGFEECGRFSRQVKISGEYDDEILMERFL